MTSINNKVYLFGGWNCVDHLNDVWVLSDSWSWSLVPIEGELPLPRRGHSSSSIGRKMYIFGGLYGFSRVKIYSSVYFIVSVLI